MKTQWLWAMMVGGSLCLLGGCASNEAAHDDQAEIAGSEDIAWDESTGEPAPDGEWQPDSGTRSEYEATAEAEPAAAAPAETVATDDGWDPALGPKEDWEAMAEAMGTTADEMAAAMMQYAFPGDHHQHLQRFVGEWDLKASMWMHPSADAQETTGTARVRSMLGGRYFLEELNMSMPEMGGDFEGLCLYGYDKRYDKYFFEWGDSWGTGLMSGEGTCDGAGKVFTYHATYDMPNMPTTEYKSVVTVINPRMHIYEMFSKGPDGEYWQHMEIVYTKR